MPSSWTISYQFQKIETGERVNVWGQDWNTNLDNISYAIGGFLPIALTGDYRLTTTNLASNEARYQAHKFTGGAGPYVVTYPSAPWSHKIWNATSGLVTITTGAGTSVQLAAGDRVEVFCDGSNVITLGYGSQALKDWISSVAGGGPGAVVPSPIAHDNQFLMALAGATQWAGPTTSQLADISAYTRARKKQALVYSMIF